MKKYKWDQNGSLRRPSRQSTIQNTKSTWARKRESTRAQNQQWHWHQLHISIHYVVSGFGSKGVKEHQPLKGLTSKDCPFNGPYASAAKCRCTRFWRYNRDCEVKLLHLNKTCQHMVCSHLWQSQSYSTPDLFRRTSTLAPLFGSLQYFMKNRYRTNL